VSARPTVAAASRRSAPARPPDRRVRDESIFPPEILLLGASPSQEVKCFALGQAERSSPHSAINLSARHGPVFAEQCQERRANIELGAIRCAGTELGRYLDAVAVDTVEPAHVPAR
jgi:hypothetical protein